MCLYIFMFCYIEDIEYNVIFSYYDCFFFFFDMFGVLRVDEGYLIFILNGF